MAEVVAALVMGAVVVAAAVVAQAVARVGRYENVSFSVTLTKMSFLIHDLSLMSARLDVSTKMSLFMITTELYLKYVILTVVTSSFA